MTTLIKARYGFLAAITAAMVVSISSPASAQRDAGAKARGEFGTGFWDRQYQPRTYSPGFIESRRSFSYEPQIETRRSYSYEPAAFDVGEDVVSLRPTRLMKGTRTLATVEGGQEFQVLDVEGPWLGAEIEVDGEKIKGWVWHRHVASAAEAEAPAAPDEAAARAAQPPIERRSYSYEPVEPMQPRFSQPPDRRTGRRMRDPIERRLRPGSGLWE